MFVLFCIIGFAQCYERAWDYWQARTSLVAKPQLVHSGDMRDQRRWPLRGSRLAVQPAQESKVDATWTIALDSSPLASLPVENIIITAAVIDAAIHHSDQQLLSSSTQSILLIFSTSLTSVSSSSSSSYFLYYYLYLLRVLKYSILFIFFFSKETVFHFFFFFSSSLSFSFFCYLSSHQQ